MTSKVAQWLRIMLVASAAMTLVLIVSQFAPSLANASVNMLFRLRGELPAPENIVIVGIDDESVRRVGKYPWTRSLTAECLDKITDGNPQVVGIDIVYSETTNRSDDERFAQSIRRSGRVVLPVQLYQTTGDESAWLAPLPEFANAAAALGHAHAASEVDGTLRSVQLSKADAQTGKRFWAFGLEVLRVAENQPPDSYSESDEILSFGGRKIAVQPEDAADFTQPARTDEMLINYAGAARTFKYYSFADVLDGKIPPQIFAGKIVLVGAASPTLGDSQVTPFMHFSGGGREGGQATPGVEIHANIINTIKQNLELKYPPAYFDLATALLIIALAALIVKFLDGWRLAAVLIVILLIIGGGSLTLFNRYFLIMPLPEMLTAFLAAIPLLLIERSLLASRDLDIKLNNLAEVQKGFLLNENQSADRNSNRFAPRNLEWKLRAVDDITTRLLSRMSFINRILTGMNEGVLVADASGKIVLANECLGEMFAVEPAVLINSELADFLSERNFFTVEELKQIVQKVKNGLIDERELQSEASEKWYQVSFSPVTAGEEIRQNQSAPNDAPLAPETVIGILILISDVTKQHEFDRLKADTMQLVSHELRSPLTSIQSLSDVLRKFPVSPEESGEMLTTIHSEAVRLNELINRFLDVERLKSGALNLQKSNVDLNFLIKNCLSNASHQAAKKQIKLEQVSGKAVPVICADAQLLSQAIDNLIGNAVKYSSPKTIVKVETAKTKSEIQIIVSDEGHGIPADALEKIFEKFYRLERDAASKTIGSGLGLSFVKEVAEKHGGRVFVESSENSGSIFIIQLPID